MTGRAGWRRNRHGDSLGAPIHLPGRIGSTLCGLTVGDDWTQVVIDADRLVCRLCHRKETT